jgi:hypothetical protein
MGYCRCMNISGIQASLLFLVFLAFGCKIDREKIIDRSRFTFTVTPDSYLFFKNVRQVYYDFTDMQEARWHVYRLSNRYTGNDYAMVHPTIVVDWVKEESYILLETNDRLAEQEVLTIQEYNTATGVTYSYQLAERGKENMLEFATKIYEGIMAENKFSIRVNDEDLPLLDHETDRENFRVVMGDYYRLTRIIR